MNTWAMLMILVLVLAPFHLWLTRNDLVDFHRWMCKWMQEDASIDFLKEARVEEEMAKLRKRNFNLFMRCTCHLDFILCILMFYQAWATPGLDSSVWATYCVVCYAFCTAAESIELTERFTYFCHFAALAAFISTAWSSAWVRSTMQGFHSAVRFCLVLVLLDPKITVPFQVLYTLVEVILHVCVMEEGDFWMQLASFSSGQLFVLVQTIASSIFIDLCLRGRIDAQLDTAEAESLLCGFRRVLRGVCDGDVLLDNHMNVAQESHCLKHLILTDVSLKGKSFEHLLVDDEQLVRFREFIEASNEAFQAPDSKGAAPPLCLRVSLRDAGGIRVATDIYHVPVPGIFGAHDLYHLLAFKEDPESRPQPEAGGDAVPSVLLPTWNPSDNAQSRRDSKSMLSESTGRSSQLPFCAELKEMSLLLDVDSELQDVIEAHLHFERDQQPRDLPSALHSTMPSLRKLVKPTDWEKVRSKAITFVERALRDPNLHPRVLKQMTWQLPHSCRVIAEEAAFKSFPNEEFPGKKLVWLHLKGFQPEKSHWRPFGLTGIQDTGSSGMPLTLRSRSKSKPVRPQSLTNR
ncbi:unnamed protein product [Durusdinium trenchii]|uniref:Reverse transcriptase domain-containing protein n=2 Tax=Durusdinium trenchii TaxID=1381693 RepID=A0ABP0QEC4_9DINO